jgi:hypothetical protein
VLGLTNVVLKDAKRNYLDVLSSRQWRRGDIASTDVMKVVPQLPCFLRREVSMSDIDPAKRRKLISAARLLESDQQGERQAAAEALVRLLPPGETVAGLLERALEPVSAKPAIDLRHASAYDQQFYQPSRSWQRIARKIAGSPGLLNERETEFVRDMVLRVDEPTEKQRAWLHALSARTSARWAA